MYNTDDDVLVSSKPQSIMDDAYLADIEEMMGNKLYHSDEFSETDDELAQEEIDKDIRPKNKTNNHVIRVYNKSWRSKRVGIHINYIVFKSLLIIYHYNNRSRIY